MLAQAGTPFELIIVDDGSTDSTPACLSGPASRGITVLTNPQRKGYGEACNRGLAVARAPFVMFLDDDDWLRPGELATLWAALERQAAAVAAVGARAAGALTPRPAYAYHLAHA